jgi:hypothetical protein
MRKKLKELTNMKKIEAGQDIGLYVCEEVNTLHVPWLIFILF